MSKAAPSQGKGSGRRKENARKVREHWDNIDWRKKSAPQGLDIQSLTDEEYDVYVALGADAVWSLRYAGKSKMPNPLDKKPQS